MRVRPPPPAPNLNPIAMVSSAFGESIVAPTPRATLNSAKPRQGYIPALNGLRAVAVLLVILDHYGLHFLPGPMGVTIFFVLSGFLITHLLIKENLRYGSVSLKRFYVRRMLRIFPALYFYLAATVFFLWIGHITIAWAPIRNSALFVMNYYRAITHDNWARTWITWSLAVEEQFYLLWPPAFVLLRGHLKRLAKILTLAILAVWIIRIVVTQTHLVSGDYVYNAFSMRCDALLMGCLLAVLVDSATAQSLLAAAKTSAWFALIPVLVLTVSAYLDLSKRLKFPYYENIALAIEPLAIAILILQVTTWWHHPLWKWLEWKQINQLGVISYGLYLYHVLTQEGFNFIAPHAPQPLKFCGALAFAILASAISFYGIEARFLKLKPAPTAAQDPSSTAAGLSQR